MNHQDIADRLKTLGDEKSKAFQAEATRIERERLSLQELCGGMGHIYKMYQFGHVYVKGSTVQRTCAVCGKEEV